jgi:hypothetical protein
VLKEAFMLTCNLKYYPGNNLKPVGEPEGKRPLGRSGRRWVDNIKVDLREIGWDSMDWIYLAQNRDK